MPPFMSVNAENLKPGDTLAIWWVDKMCYRFILVLGVVPVGKNRIDVTLLYPSPASEIRQIVCERNCILSRVSW